MAARYKYTDQVIRYMNTEALRLFDSLKSLAAFDELNVLQAVRPVYEELDIITRWAYRKLGNHYYRMTRRAKDLQSLDDQWVDELLEAYDPVTKYVFTHEEDRKCARLIEALIASATPTKEIDAALRSWARMTREYAVRVTDQAVTDAFLADGERYARWVSENDTKVCSECEARDGKIYPLADFPPKPHINCRCWRVRV